MLGGACAPEQRQANRPIEGANFVAKKNGPIYPYAPHNTPHLSESAPVPDGETKTAEKANLLEPRGLTADRAALFQQAADTCGVRFADELDKWMSDFSVKSVSIAEVALKELADKDAGHITVLDCDDGVSRGLIAIDLSLALGFATLLLGGRHGDYVDARPLTALETGVLEQVISPLTAIIVDAYRLNPVAIEGHVSETYLIPDLGDDPAMEISVVIEGAQLEGQFTFGLYMSTLQRFSESVDRRLAGTSGGRRYRQNSMTHRAVQPVPLEISVGFDPMPVSAGDIASLQEGDVLRTRHPVTKDLIARVGESTIFSVRAGQIGKRLVAEIIGDANHQPPSPKPDRAPAAGTYAPQGQS